VLDRLRGALVKYRKYRHPDLPELVPSDLYALFPEKGKPLAAMYWDQKWPNSDHAGVYLIFDKNAELLYVGTAWVLGGRLSKYFQYRQPRGEDHECRVVDRWPKPGPMYIATVPVPDDSKFEAASLEEYLIGELNPSVNVRRMADR
jgi:hypothetical protein